MKKILAALLSIITVSSLSSVYAQEPIILEQLSPSEKVLVKLEWPEVEPDQLYHFKVFFVNPETDQLIMTNMRVDYAIAVTQNGHVIEHYDHQKTLTGEGEFEVVFPEDGMGPAEVIVEINSVRSYAGYSVEMLRLDEEVSFTVEVIPEFEALAMLVLALSFVSLLFLARGKLKIKYSQ